MKRHIKSNSNFITSKTDYYSDPYRIVPAIMYEPAGGRSADFHRMDIRAAEVFYMDADRKGFVPAYLRSKVDACVVITYQDPTTLKRSEFPFVIPGFKFRAGNLEDVFVYNFNEVHDVEHEERDFYLDIVSEPDASDRWWSTPLGKRLISRLLPGAFQGSWMSEIASQLDLGLVLSHSGHNA